MLNACRCSYVRTFCSAFPRRRRLPCSRTPSRSAHKSCRGLSEDTAPGLAECRHVITYALQQPPCDAFAAVLRLDIYGTDIRPHVRSVVKIILYNAQPADYLAVAAEHHIPAWDSARREAVIHALKICRQRHTLFLVEPLHRRLNKLRTVTQAYKFILHR